jgi:hypothetical protein
MTSPSSLNFANQDLRNRRFKGRNLNDADFSNCDIRGCDFSYALLQGANFERVRTGRTRRQFITLAMVTILVALIAANAFTQMIFGALGRTAAEPAWSFILALGISLAIAGAFSGVRVRAGTQSIVGHVATAVSGAASGALLGFFYAGTATNNNTGLAIAGAVIGGVGMAITNFRVRHGFVAVAVAVAGAVASYGFAFLVGAIAIAYLSTQKLVWAVIWGTLSAGYILLTINCIGLAIREFTSACGTSFRGADLTNARFDAARLQNTDFRGAEGTPAGF